MLLPNPLLKRIVDINTSGRIALCGYFLTGYTSPKTFYPLIRSLDAIDIFEFGIPSENPFLDGPDISRAHNHITGHIGLNAETALSLLGGLQDISQPRFVMTYARDGRELDGFLRNCLLNGLHGILAPDIPVEEAQSVSRIASSLNLTYVGFIHDRLTTEEVDKIVELCDMIYLKVSCGPTGQKGDPGEDCINLISRRIEELRYRKPELLIAAGIGIQTPEQVRKLATLDINMVVIGTSILNTIPAGVPTMQEYVRKLRNATVRSQAMAACG